MQIAKILFIVITGAVLLGGCSGPPQIVGRRVSRQDSHQRSQVLRKEMRRSRRQCLGRPVLQQMLRGLRG